MTTHHLPISIPDILHGKTVERERLEFEAGSNPEADFSSASFQSGILTGVPGACSIHARSLQPVSTTGRGTVPPGAVLAWFMGIPDRSNPQRARFIKMGLTNRSFASILTITKPARPLAEAQIGGSLVYGGRQA